MTPEELHDVVGNMKGVNSHAKIIVTQNSKVDLKEVLGIGSFSIERSLEMVRALSSFRCVRAHGSPDSRLTLAAV